MNMMPTTQIRNKNRYKIFAEFSSDLISTITPQGVFTYVSPSVHNILGLDAEVLVGNHLYNYIHPDDIDIFTKHQLQILENQQHTSLLFRMMNHKNEYVWMETRVQLIHDAKTGMIKELILISNNANDKIMQEEKFKQTEKILSETQSLAKIGSWNYDPSKDEIFWSSGMRTIYKLSNDFVPSIKAYTSMIHPEDKERVLKNL
jgi:PAS domain S-box-containing protein